MDKPLTSSDYSHLRSEGRRLTVTATVGKAGLTEAVALQISTLLAHHELVKVRIPPSDKAGRAEMAQKLAAKTAATLVELLGRTVLLYKPLPKQE